jgi:hypothetical protein
MKDYLSSATMPKKHSREVGERGYVHGLIWLTSHTRYFHGVTRLIFCIRLSSLLELVLCIEPSMLETTNLMP